MELFSVNSGDHIHLYCLGDNSMQEWLNGKLIFVQTRLKLGANDRPFLADLVMHLWVVETDLKFSVKIGK